MLKFSIKRLQGELYIKPYILKTIYCLKRINTGRITSDDVPMAGNHCSVPSGLKDFLYPSHQSGTDLNPMHHVT